MLRDRGVLRDEDANRKVEQRLGAGRARDRDRFAIREAREERTDDGVVRGVGRDRRVGIWVGAIGWERCAVGVGVSPGAVYEHAANNNSNDRITTSIPAAGSMIHVGELGQRLESPSRTA